MDTDLDLALAMADVADQISLRRFRANDLVVDTKPDLTPVSDADREVERTLRALIDTHRPGDGVVGEEFGSTGGPGRTWVIDPIDGTRNFVRGVPVWATLIALRASSGDVAVVSAPALGRRWWADHSEAFMSWNGEVRGPLQVSAVSALADAFWSLSSASGWAGAGRAAEFARLDRAVWYERGYGDFWSYMLVAEGACDLAAEPEVGPWDIAACQIIVNAAGGMFTDLAGVDGAGGTSALASNGLIHAEAIELLAGA